MSEPIIQIKDVYKQYKLGTIGGGTLSADLQSWWAKIRHKEDPNLRIGQESHDKNETFMALNGVSVNVCSGDTLGIIGGNGAGKSTLLKLLSRVTAPTKGTIEYKGRISSMLEVGTGFHPELTGRENIYMNGAILGMSRAEVDSKIDKIIEFSECAKFIDTPVKRYSSGMYVKLAFSVSAHLDSEILVMDEVLAVGDMKFQKKCIDKMSTIAKSEGRTILYVSHNMNTIRQLCNRCIVLKDGRVIFDGEPEEAITIYLEQNQVQQEIFNDYTNVPRMEYLSQDFKARLQSLEIINKKSCYYKNDEPLEFELAWKVFENIGNLSLRLTISYQDDIPVATALFNNFMQCEANVEYAEKFSLDISSLASGIYKTKIVLYELGELEQSIDFDVITHAFAFEKEKSLSWKEQYWGRVQLPDIKNKL